MTIDCSTDDDPIARLNHLTDLATPFAIRAVVTLRVPDQIAGGVDQLDQLAKVVGADRDALGRLIRYLTHRGLFTEPAPDVFALTAMGELLCDRSTTGKGAWLDFGGYGARVELAYTGLPHAVRTGEPGYASVHGRDFWADLDADPTLRSFFDDLMASQQDPTAPQVAALYPWHDVAHLMDIGGGTGRLLATVLHAHPHMRGTLVDRAEPVAAAAATFAEHGVADRAQVVVGDFFAPLPAGADVYVVSRALTDWSDRHATAILRRCAEAAGSTGRVLVVEVMPSEPYVPNLAPYDLQMLVVVGGRERAVDDHLALADAAGLKLSRTFVGAKGLTLMEFVAAE